MSFQELVLKYGNGDGGRLYQEAFVCTLYLAKLTYREVRVLRVQFDQNGLSKISRRKPKSSPVAAANGVQGLSGDRAGGV